MANLSPNELLTALECFKKNPPAELANNPTLTAKLSRASRQLSVSLEKPTDVIVRLFLSSRLENSAVQIGCDLGLFTTLKESETPKSSKELSEITKADETLLIRILRCLAAFGAIQEVGSDGYTLSPNYEMLGSREVTTAITNFSHVMGGAYQSLPKFLSSTEYKNPTDPMNTAGHQVLPEAEGVGIMDYLTSSPENAKEYGALMKIMSKGTTLIHDIYPINERLGKGFDMSSSDAVMLVDVGGGFGQKIIPTKTALPELPGRFIIQDLPATLANAPVPDGIEMMDHDFFTEQPVKGARAYYICQCLHDWPVDECVKILSRLRDAMKPGYSRLLIHESVISDRNSTVWQVTQDFTMMAMCASMERTEGQWRDILGKAGLEMVEIYSLSEGNIESVIEAEVA